MRRLGIVASRGLADSVFLHLVVWLRICLHMYTFGKAPFSVSYGYVSKDAHCQKFYLLHNNRILL